MILQKIVDYDFKKDVIDFDGDTWVRYPVCVKLLARITALETAIGKMPKNYVEVIGSIVGLDYYSSDFANRADESVETLTKFFDELAALLNNPPLEKE